VNVISRVFADFARLSGEATVESSIEAGIPAGRVRSSSRLPRTGEVASICIWTVVFVVIDSKRGGGMKGGLCTERRQGCERGGLFGAQEKAPGWSGRSVLTIQSSQLSWPGTHVEESAAGWRRGRTEHEWIKKRRGWWR
jgi:hypothetical protein